MHQLAIGLPKPRLPGPRPCRQHGSGHSRAAPSLPPPPQASPPVRVSPELTHPLGKPEPSFPLQRQPGPEGGLSLGGSTSGVDQLFSSPGGLCVPEGHSESLSSSYPVPPARERQNPPPTPAPNSGKSHLAGPSCGTRAVALREFSPTSQS